MTRTNRQGLFGERTLLVRAVLILVLVFRSASFGHEQKTALTDIFYNERTGNLEIAHRIRLHDAEHALHKIKEVNSDLARSSEARDAFAKYVAVRFALSYQDKTKLKLKLIGQELERGFLWVYQETKIPTPGNTSILIENSILQDAIKGQVNTVNVRFRKDVSTFEFKAGTPAQLFEGPDLLAATADDEIEIPAISAIVRSYFPADAEGGLALLVTKKNEIIHCKGYGKVNGETPVTPTSKLPLASVTKQFAGMCGAILIEEGKLKMTDKVSDYLPELKFKSPGRELLVQDLFWHTSGLPNFIKKAERESIAAFKKERGLKNLSNKTHAEWLATLPLVRKPGTEFEYTNSGWVLFCRIAEVVTKRPFHEFQQERIFDPLKMTATKDSTRFNGSGNMTTTLLDYAKWDRALWNGTFLERNYSELYFAPGKLDNGERFDYAMGWRLEFDGKELIRVYHGGVGGPPRNARNLVSRNLKKKTTVALFIRENTSIGKDKRAEFVKKIEDLIE